MNKILNFLASDDIEMVRLGLSMVKSQPKNHWNLYVEYVNGRFNCALTGDDFLVMDKYPQGLWTQLNSNGHKYTYVPNGMFDITTTGNPGSLTIYGNGSVGIGTSTITTAINTLYGSSTSDTNDSL